MPVSVIHSPTRIDEGEKIRYPRAGRRGWITRNRADDPNTRSSGPRHPCSHKRGAARSTGNLADTRRTESSRDYCRRISAGLTVRLTFKNKLSCLGLPSPEARAHGSRAGLAQQVDARASSSGCRVRTRERVRTVPRHHYSLASMLAVDVQDCSREVSSGVCVALGCS